MEPQSRFRSLIKRTELVGLALCAAVGLSLYVSGTVFAQTEYDPMQSYLDSQVGGLALTATPGACGTGTIVLQWPTISQVDGYRVARDGSSVIYEGAAPTYTDTGLAAGSAHTYYLTAFQGYTTSNTTKMVSATAPGTCTTTAPAAPTNLSASYNQTAGGIVLNWSAGTSFTGSNVLRRATGGSFGQIGSLTGTQTTYTDTSNLVAGTTYEYQVVACSSVGCSGPSGTASATIPNTTTQTTGTATTATTTTTTTTTTTPSPSPATGLTAQYDASVGGIRLSWTNGSVAATYISIERRSTGGTFAAIQGVSGSQTSHTDISALTPATIYEYRLISCNGSANCVNSANTATAATPSATSGTTATTDNTSTTGTTATTNTTIAAPAAPVVSITTPSACGTFTLYLSWSVVSGATSYDIYRDNALVVHTNNTAFGDVGLTAGSQHTYRVAARNSAGVTPSALVTGTVPSACAATATSATETVTTQTQPTTQAAPTESTAVAPVQSAPVATNPSATLLIETPPVQSAPAPAPAYTSFAPPPSQSTTPQQAPSVIVESMQSVVETVQNAQIAVDSAKQEIIRAIDAHIAAVLSAGAAENRTQAEARAKEMRDALISEIEIVIDGATTLTPAQLQRLQKIADDGLIQINSVAVIDTTVPAVTRTGVSDAITQLGSTLQQVTEVLQSGPVAQVYKDTNKDGISDYDSIHIYGLDPIAPSPVTIVDGKKITAGEKVLRGYDPKATELIPVVHEEPAMSLAPETTVYKVETVNLTEDKTVRITGTAIPNSYVTLYIYSTPVVVTVKTDRNGKWEYTVDRELETGEHKIYAASVDNTGKIVAKTVAIPFTRTAEAATLDTVPPLGAQSTERPGLLNNRAVMPLAALSIIFILGVLYVMGKDRTPKNPAPPAPPAPTAA